MGTPFVIIILCATLKTVSSSCPMECECPRDIPSCGPGVSLVLDGCGCCQVCARQLNEDCTSNKPCDHIKGLECNFGGGHGTINGICRAKSDGRPCEYNNHIYQNGESFCLDCKHQCTCMDGAVGCVSLHPHEITWPKLDCANKASLVKVHGRCCEQLMISCPEEEKTGRPAAPTKKHSKEVHRGDRQSVQDITDDENELTPVGRGRSKYLPDFNSEPMGHTLTRGRECVTEPTAWTPCSKSCGTGVSSRSSGIIRNNGQCKLVKETRICEVRPCSQTAFTSLKMGQKCNNVEKAKQPAKLFHAGCHSLRTFRPRYCGVCSDGRCCSPHQTHTLHIRFRCEDGETFSKNVMMIRSCKCDFNCSHSNDNNPSVLYRLLNDIHKSYG